MPKLLVFTFAMLSMVWAPAALEAQQVVAPTAEQVGSPRGDTLDGYNVSQSFELGYRFKAVGGDEGMYRSVADIGNGLRLLGSSLSVYSKDGHGRYFDEIVLNTLGLGNDNYQSAVLRIQKNRLYRYDLTWRLDAYYNPGLDVAGGLHLEDTIRRLQDHDLTLLPQSKLRFRVGYSRNTEDGPALSTAQEFDLNGSGLPVFTKVRRQWNEYRMGADAEFAGLKLTVTRRWDFFKDDTPSSAAGVVAAGTAGDQTVLQQFQRTEPIHGANPGWLGNLYGRRKLWGMNAHLTYVSGSGDFALDELAAGLGQSGTPATRQIAVGGDAHRPDLAGDFSISLFPSDNLTVVNNSSLTSNRIDGNSSYSEFITGLNLGTTIYFRYLGVRTVSNSTDINYRLRKWIGFYSGYHYSDRLVRTIEGTDIPAFGNSLESDLYQVSNHLNSVTAGVRLRPWKPLTFNLGGEVGRANFPLTPVSDKHYQSINGRADYRLKKLQLTTAYREVYNLNAPFVLSTFVSHSREYSASGSWAPNNWFTIDASYSKIHLDTRAGIAFFASSGTQPQLEALPSYYTSNVHAANLATHFAVGRRADILLGYTITKDTGDGRATAVPAGVTDPVQALTDSVQTFPLTYQAPMARLSIRITPKVRWNAGWQFYNYVEQFHLFGNDQNFHAHTGYTSVLWSF